MGVYFEVQCTECGYHETLYEGECGFEHLDAIKMKQEFESGKGNPFYREIFELFRGTVTEEDSTGNRLLFDDVEPGSDEREENRLLYGEPYIRLTPTIYECHHCKKLFNHDRVSIICKSGIFRENDVECPTCKTYFTRSIPVEDFFEDKEEPRSGYVYICKARCPKCHSKMKVINSGIAG